MPPYGYSTADSGTNTCYPNTTDTGSSSLTYIPYYWCGISANTTAVYNQSNIPLYIYVNPMVGQSDQEWKESLKKAEAADKRARELLKQHIGLEAFGKLHEVGYIELDSQKYSGQKYRVKSSAREYIEVIDESRKVIDRLCIHPTVRCPDGDEILAKILLIESAEEFLLATANRHRP